MDADHPPAYPIHNGGNLFFLSSSLKTNGATQLHDGPICFCKTCVLPDGPGRNPEARHSKVFPDLDAKMKEMIDVEPPARRLGH